MIAKAAPQYSLANKSTLVAISGSGNVAQYTALKVIELGATVISLSDSKGALIAQPGTGFTAEAVRRISTLKLQGGSLEGFSGDGEYTYHAGESAEQRYMIRAKLASTLQANAPGHSFRRSTSPSRAPPKTRCQKKKPRRS